MTSKHECSTRQRSGEMESPQREGRTTLGYDVDVEDDDSLYTTRLPTSARRWTTTDPSRQVIQRPSYDVQVHSGYTLPKSVPRRSSRQQAQQTPPRLETGKQHVSPRPKRLHWMLILGIGMCAMLVLWIVGSVLLTWWHGRQDDMTYGRPRTFQTDAVVGHNDASTPSHFIAINLHRQIEVLECPGGDCSKAIVYVGPLLVGAGQDLDPVTLEFKDVNRDGKLDMLIHVSDQTFVFLNDAGKFRPARPEDHIAL